jgi:hypothetical protein
MVLTFLLPNATIAVGENLSVVCKSARCGAVALESNVRRAPKTGCAGETCAAAQACIEDRCVTVAMSGAAGGFGKIIALLVALVAGGGGGFFLYRRKKAKEKEDEEPQPGHPGQHLPGQPPYVPGQPVIMPQVVVPDYSNMPYVGNSAAVQQMQQQLANIPYVGAAIAAQQAAAQKAAAPPPQAASTRVSSIMVLSGPQSGQTFKLRHGFTIGKVRGCDLVLDDGFTSNHHAQFHLDLGGGCTVVDLGSTNGVFVNGVRTHQQRLTHGTSLRVGQTDIRFLQG